MQSFAAPRNSGLWHEIREQIVEQIAPSGRHHGLANGVFGPEVRAEIPAAAGQPGTRLARFVGVDGPRWFLRGVISGKGAVDPRPPAPRSRTCSAASSSCAARPRCRPRDLIPLHVPPGSAGTRRPTRPSDGGRPTGTTAREPALTLPGRLRRGRCSAPARRGETGGGTQRPRAAGGDRRHPGSGRGDPARVSGSWCVYTITHELWLSVLAPLAIAVVFIVVRDASVSRSCPRSPAPSGSRISAGLALLDRQRRRQLPARIRHQRRRGRRAW